MPKDELDAQLEQWTEVLVYIRKELVKFLSVPERRAAWECGEAEMVVRHGLPVFFRQVVDEPDEPGGQYL